MIIEDVKQDLSHYAFNVNKLQETKSSLSLLMGNLTITPSSLMYFLSEMLAVSQSLNELKNSTTTSQGLSVFTYTRELTRELPCIQCSLKFT